MLTMLAMAIAQSTPKGNEKVFDWHKAAQIIRDRKPTTAEAGLSGDWEWTGGCIYRDGKPVLEDGDDDYTYLASNWCKAELSVGGELIDCWIPQSEQPSWKARTRWPESALAILNHPE